MLVWKRLLTISVLSEWVYEVFIVLFRQWELSEEFLQDYSIMGIMLHISLANLKRYDGEKQVVVKLLGYAVLFRCDNYAATK